MLLVNYEYEEFQSDPSMAWKLAECEFNQVNLIVGRNASGKSRAINTIYALIKIVTGKVSVSAVADGTFTLTLIDSLEPIGKKKPQKLIYKLVIQNFKVKEETLSNGKKPLLTRKEDGTGFLPAKQLKQDISFEIKTDQLALTAKRDKLQHPFLEPLITWVETVRYFKFSGSSGQELGHVYGQSKSNDLLLKDDWDEPLGAAISKAQELYGDDFSQTICQYMRRLGYPLSWLGLRPVNILNQPNQNLITVVSALEDDRNGYVDQQTFSTGMFRALTVLIRCEWAKRLGVPFTVLIDDIGEGLDFERSKDLIKILISFTENKKIQLIMSTNDRFVMNTVPLEYWSIFQRENSVVTVFNNKNHKDAFENFQDYGFNNFDFFSRKYFDTPVSESSL